jgi:hypothetical protein
MMRGGSILLALCALVLSVGALAELRPDIIEPPDPVILEVTCMILGALALGWALAWLFWLALGGRK